VNVLHGMDDEWKEDEKKKKAEKRMKKRPHLSVHEISLKNTGDCKQLGNVILN